MTDGTVTQKPKYHCIANEHDGPMQADELRVFYGQLWCSDCWYTHSKVGKRWDDLDRFADVPAAEQQPAAWARMKGGKVAEAFPDRKLADALESLIKGYVGLLEAGMDRITSLGGDCDPVPVMVQNDPWLRDARAALAAYRKQGGEA